MENKRGITLIALIITIIVLLILAGVSLAMLMGNDGIIFKAVKAKNDTEIAKEKEMIELAVGTALMKNLGGEIVIKDIEEAIDTDKVDVIDNGDTIAIKFKESERYYNIKENGNVELFTPYFDDTPGKLTPNSNGEYMIESIEDLVTFSAIVNGGYSDDKLEIETFPQWTHQKIVLMCDLDFESELSYDNSETMIYNGYLGIEEDNVTLKEALTNIEKYKGFIPIGNGSVNFTISFDGKNHYIKNLYENTDTYAGLFGKIADSNVKNITVKGNISSTNYAGGVVGWLDRGDLESVTMIGNVYSTNYAGGIVGYMVTQSYNSMINNCTNNANVQGISSGGIMGWCAGYGSGTGSIINCQNAGNINASGNSGGLIGTMNYCSFDIKYCENSGEIIGNNVGGLVGVGNPNIYSSCLKLNSKINGITNAGGFVGHSYGITNIYNSINNGEIIADVNARRFYRK